MLGPIPGAPEGVIALRAAGRVSADDYRTVLEPAVEKVVAARQKVRSVIGSGDDFDGLSGGGAWEDMSFGMTHLSDWQRLVVVTDLEHLAGAVRLFGGLMPGEVMVFPTVELRDALAWAAG